MASRRKQRALEARASQPKRRRRLLAFLGRLPRADAEGIPARLVLAMTFIVLFGAAGAMSVIDSEETAMLAWALLLLIAVSAFVRILPASGAIATVLSVGTYGGIQLMRTIRGGNYFPQIFTAMACFLIAAWICRAAAQRLQLDEDEVLDKSILLDELTMQDTITGAIKRQHAHKRLAEELQRSRRYAHSLTLLIIGIDDWETIIRDRGAQQGTELLVGLAGIIGKSTRNLDTVSRHDESRFAAILPETPLEGARIVAERICQSTLEEMGVTARVGIAEFPADAVTGDELITEAEEALEFARAAELRIADRKILA